MSLDTQKHHRHSVRLKGYDYSQPGAYFLTLVTWQRACLFGKILDGEVQLHDLGNVVKHEWKRLAQRFKHIELDEFTIMPNHLHGIIIINENGAGKMERFGKPVAGSIPCLLYTSDAADE